MPCSKTRSRDFDITIPTPVDYIANSEVPKMSVIQLQQNPDVMDAVMHSSIPINSVYSNLIINLAVTLWSSTIWIFAVRHVGKFNSERFSYVP